MAIYHLSIKIGSRSKGKSAIAAAAYRASEKLYDHEIGEYCDYTKKRGTVHSGIILCVNAPERYRDREKLWQAVHEIERASNAQLFREIEIAVPIELSRSKQIKLVREYVQPFVDEGMCADWSLHDKGDGNPHAHIMLTTRPIKETGEWGDKERKEYALDESGNRIPIIDEKTGEQKLDSRNRKQWKREYVQVNDWNNKDKAEFWRQNWADICNKYLAPVRIKIDHRSYKRQGIEQTPTIHEGYVARKIEADSGVSERCEYNRQVRLLTKVKNSLISLASEIKSIITELSDRIANTITAEPIPASINNAPTQNYINNSMPVIKIAPLKIEKVSSEQIPEFNPYDKYLNDSNNEYGFLDMINDLGTSDDDKIRRLADIDKQVIELKAGRSMGVILAKDSNTAKQISALLSEKRELENGKNNRNNSRYEPTL